jgi:small conductance mechanosensitive channel
MTRYLALVAKFVVLCLTLGAAPLLAQQTPAVPAPAAPPVAQPVNQDARIRTQAQRALAGAEGVLDVRVQVRDGVVVLTGTILDPAQSDALEARVARIEGVLEVDNQLEVSTDVVERLTPVAQRFQRQTERLLASFPLLAVAIGAWALIAWLGYRLAALRWPWDRIAPNEFIGELIRQMIRLVAVMAGAVIALDVLGASALLGTLLGAAGILGLAVGFAVRDVVENFIASILLSLRSPFRPNDLIEVAGDTGRVVRLTARATILISPDGNQIRIPNATVFKARVVNFTRQPERRFTVRLPVKAGADMAHAVATAQGALVAAPFVLPRPAPSVWLAEIAPDGTAFLEAAGWIDNSVTGFAPARGEALRRMSAALTQAGIALPGIDPATAHSVPQVSVPPQREQEVAVEKMAAAEAEATGGEQLLGGQTRDE